MRPKNAETAPARRREAKGEGGGDKVEAMEKAGRLLLAFSLLGFLLVVLFGVARASPLHLRLDNDPSVVTDLKAFHAHFDGLVWLGAAALGAALSLSADRYRGSPKVPFVLAIAYCPGALFFSLAYAVKGLGLFFGLSYLVRPAAPLLASAGGLLLLLAAAAAAVVAWWTLATPSTGDSVR